MLPTSVLRSVTEMGDLATHRNVSVDQIAPNPRRRHARNAKFYFSQYCGATSIHGMQYLGERGRYAIEKIVWFLIILTVATCSTILVLKTYRKWVTSPVIVSFATSENSISEIPFPAVTICPVVKSNVETFNFTDAYLKKILGTELPPFDEEAWRSLSLICSIDLPASETDDDLFVNDTAVAMLLNVFPELDSENISELKWRGKILDPNEYFSYTFTSEGICYSFNMLDAGDIIKNPEEYTIPTDRKSHNVREWSLDKGYSTSDIDDSYPMRTFVSGALGGFVFDAMTTKRKDLDYLCQESLQGYKVVLHHPAEWPNLDRHFRVPLNSAVDVGIKPRVTGVSPTLRDYDPKRRKCYFTEERQLTYFRKYTQTNCLQECLSNYTLRTCGCLGFYMPKDRDTPICGPGNLPCLYQSKIDYPKHDKEACFCLPSCTSLEYDIELSIIDWDWHRAINAMRAVSHKNYTMEFEKLYLARLSIFFKDMQFLASERNELYGFVDFLSSIGGLLGLFIGISITSFIEVIYFCTLRLWCNLKKYGPGYWSGEPDLVDEDEQNGAKVL
ncbi:pickpocket protein 28-like isoform X2 [Photinus pyralis]|nr:pickpocket protein 28-like isoform X2 [Photinus pyralis]